MLSLEKKTVQMFQSQWLYNTFVYDTEFFKCQKGNNERTKKSC